MNDAHAIIFVLIQELGHDDSNTIVLSYEAFGINGMTNFEATSL